MSYAAAPKSVRRRVVASALGLGALLWLVVGLRESAVPQAQEAPAPRTHGAAADPVLRGRWERAAGALFRTAGADAAGDIVRAVHTRDAPPPEVFVQADRPSAPTAALRMRVVLPWGDLPYREPGDAGYAEADWILAADEDDVFADVSFGRFDTDGFGSLTADELAFWNHVPLRVTALGCRELVLHAPPRPLPSTLVIQMDPEGATTRFRGRVRDDRGAPLAGAGVFLEDWEWQAGARTAADGTFDLRVPAERAELGSREDDEGRALLPLVAVAPGRLASTYQARVDGEDGIDITLLRDSVHARLELRFVKADGTAAGGARAWIYPASESFGEWIASGHTTFEGDEGNTRRFLPRVTGGASVDAQGLEVVQDDTLLLDLVADGEGRLVLPALRPGSWRIRAVLGTRTDDHGWSRHPGLYDIHVGEIAETTVDVHAPPIVTQATIPLRTGRSVTGVIDVAVNAAWHCDHASHIHFVRVEDWEWGQVRVRSGPYEMDGAAHAYSGRFRFDGLPNEACRLVVHTIGHPDVLIQLPEAEAGGNVTDIGTLHVPDARMMTVEIVAFDGAALPDWRGHVELQGMPGTASPWSITWSSGESTRFRFLLAAPPPSEARLVVRLPDRADPAAVVRAPVRLEGNEPIVIRLPR